MEDRIRGMLEAHALGDALGAAFEFNLDKIANYRGYLEIPLCIKSRWQGTRYGVIGQVTDDTMMTLALTESLIRNNGYNRDDIILSYERFANSTGMVGKNTRNLFKGIKTVSSYDSRYSNLLIPNSEGKSLMNVESNGSLMRASPLIVLSNEHVILDCKLTNPSLVNQDCSLVYVSMLRLLVQGNDPKSVFDYIISCSHTLEMNQIIQTILSATYDNYNLGGKSKGWVINGFYCALFCSERVSRFL